jgi:hypothetical protein
MAIIGELFYLGPLTVITNFDTGAQYVAQVECKRRQLAECSEAPLLRYHDDPLIIEPCAIVANDEHGVEQLFTSDTDHTPKWVLWDGNDGHYYMAHPSNCYDIRHTRPIN